MGLLNFSHLRVKAPNAGLSNIHNHTIRVLGVSQIAASAKLSSEMLNAAGLLCSFKLPIKWPKLLTSNFRVPWIYSTNC